MTDFSRLSRLVLAAKKSAWRDSNDEEIDALQMALDEACALLGFDTFPLYQQAEEWAEQEGLT